MTASDETFMYEALREAELALAAEEVPVGAVVVADGVIVGRGHNRVIANSDPTAHAEIMALRDAGLNIKNYRLAGASVFTTIEPCAMCAGALIHARIERLVYGAPDPRFGAVDTHFHICTSDVLNHRLTVKSGILESQCREVIQSFFRKKRSTE